MSLDDAPTLIITLVVILIVGGVGLLVATGFQDSLTADTAAYNATNQGISSVANFFNMMPVLGTILIAVILLAAVIGGFYFASRKL